MIKSNSKTTSEDTPVDPVKFYLKDVRKAPLLTHDREVQLSQQIENSKQTIIDTLFAVPISVKTVSSWIDAIKENEILVSDVFDVDADAETVLTQEFKDQLDQARALCDTYLNDNSYKPQLVEMFNELTLNTISLNKLVEQVSDINQKLIACDGNMLRVAMECVLIVWSLSIIMWVMNTCNGWINKLQRSGSNLRPLASKTLLESQTKSRVIPCKLDSMFSLLERWLRSSKPSTTSRMQLFKKWWSVIYDWWSALPRSIARTIKPTFWI